MPSLTTSNHNICSTSLQQGKILLNSKTSSYTNNNTQSLKSFNENIKQIQSPQRTYSNSHHRYHHHSHIRRLSALDCHILKNEIVKLNLKSSYCFDDNTYDYSKSTNWKANEEYKINDLVCYNRQYYKVIQDVISEKDQTPDIANDYYILIISRVSKVASKRVLISKWTPYCRFITKGEQVYYDGKVWTALVSQNYEENKKRNPLFIADSPDQPSQKGLWEIENYNIDELEIVEDMIEFSDYEETSSIISDKDDDADEEIDSSSTITDEDNSFLSNITKELNNMDITSSSSTINSTNTIENDNYMKEIQHRDSESGSNSDNTINEEESYNYIKVQKKLN
ncbi:hypothetical protein BCR32DRAFT_263838 [Anaeromyces robustus]|uniref:Uncharacterized protein n=1 Tax=Anaeromyces robustus TaxID=1754192 RepID=A0A1Y1XQE1_9FUNG|nr:hypothetical protein BCR32DRAFT_263838 [Anaeromyces robustus]|eukprot:ORX87969.1 hypothetical protein BCR32DRAFT_263838 [Anaeromyces robustus]